jgi:hypothetical protein
VIPFSNHGETSSLKINYCETPDRLEKSSSRQKYFPKLKSNLFYFKNEKRVKLMQDQISTKNAQSQIKQMLALSIVRNQF